MLGYIFNDTCTLSEFNSFISHAQTVLDSMHVHFDIDYCMFVNHDHCHTYYFHLMSLSNLIRNLIDKKEFEKLVAKNEYLLWREQETKLDHVTYFEIGSNLKSEFT